MIEQERPDALLPTLGGQTALNLAKALHDDGTLAEFGVELIGANYDAIHRAEDRELFDQTMQSAGLRTAKNAIVTTVEAAMDALDDLGLPAIIRPGVHARRARRRHRPHARGVREDRRRRASPRRRSARC